MNLHSHVPLLAPLLCAWFFPAPAPEALGGATHSVHVSGTGTDLLNGAIVHSKHSTPGGLTQKSTESVELDGDVHGRVLYQVTSVFDFKKGTLVNTGHQVFSGTIAGSEPVMIHDSNFRFDVNLASGADRGRVYLLDHIAGPEVSCSLQVIGTGKNSEGNPTFNYSGECTFWTGR